MNNDRMKLIRAAKEADISIVQFKMAGILLAINGLQSALEFIEQVKKKQTA